MVEPDAGCEGEGVVWRCGLLGLVGARVPWRSGVRRSLRVWEIDSTRWRIGVEPGAGSGFLCAGWADDGRSELFDGVFEAGAGYGLCRR